MLSHNSLGNYYNTLAIMIRHNYSLSELENMYPYELETYIGLVQKHLEELQKKHDEQH